MVCRLSRISLKDALKAIEQYKKIPIQFVEISLEESVKIAYNLGIYAYDSYFLTGALKLKLPILTLDKNLGKNALDSNISIVEV